MRGRCSGRELDVQIVSVTEQWAQYAIAGPNSRRLLERLLGDALDLSNEAFPYLACAEFSWRGIRARLFRISFSGELAYELAVPARYGDATIRAIMAAGADWDIVPYGTRSARRHAHRKGTRRGQRAQRHDHGGRSGPGSHDVDEEGFHRSRAGRAAGAERIRTRPTLVGIKPVDRNARLHAGAHFLREVRRSRMQNDQGYVTSVAYLADAGALDRARPAGARSAAPWRTHSRLRPGAQGDVEVEVVSPVFFDPEGVRLKG